MWFKRDLRLRDNAALESAIRKTDSVEGKGLLLIYVLEPSLIADQHYDLRHWRFVLESLTFLNKQLNLLKPLLKSEGSEGTDRCIHIFFREVSEVFTALGQLYHIDQVFSHQEPGLRITYDRDLNFADYCLRPNITWHEFSKNGIIRKLKNKKGRFSRWTKKMNSPQRHPDFEKFTASHLDEKWASVNRGDKLPASWKERDQNFQQGGEDIAFRYMDSFLKLGYTVTRSLYPNLWKVVRDAADSRLIWPWVA